MFYQHGRQRERARGFGKNHVITLACKTACLLSLLRLINVLTSEWNRKILCGSRVKLGAVAACADLRESCMTVMERSIFMATALTRAKGLMNFPVMQYGSHLRTRKTTPRGSGIQLIRLPLARRPILD